VGAKSTFTQDKSGWSVNLTDLCLVSRLRMSEAIAPNPPSPYMPFWPAQRQLYIKLW